MTLPSEVDLSAHGEAALALRIVGDAARVFDPVPIPIAEAGARLLGEPDICEQLPDKE